jgi:hypothetical protein
MGIRASIYRDDFQPTSNNLFGSVNDLTIVNAEGPFQPDEEAPAAIIMCQPNGGTRYVAPAMLNDEGEWVELVDNRCGGMAGGAFVASSDSRFRKAAGLYGALALHDWYEEWEVYHAMSRD